MLLYLVRTSWSILFIADFWKKIGDAAVEDLKVESADGEEIPVSLNQVFPDLAELGSQEDLGLKKKVANDFDLDHFRQLMARDGLRFADRAVRCLKPLCHCRGEEMDLV